MANNTGIIIGVSVVAVLGIVITIVIVKSKAAPVVPYNPNNYPLGYPNMYPPGYVPPQNNSDKAALYTGAASVINKVLDSFWGKSSANTSSQPYNSLTSQQMNDSYLYGSYTDNSGTDIYTDHG